jgi:uncharacterized membrane protein
MVTSQHTDLENETNLERKTPMRSQRTLKYRWIAALTLTPWITGCPPVPQGEPETVTRYQVVDLGTLGGQSPDHFHYAQAISNSGYITGNSGADSENPEIASPFRFRGYGPMENLGILSGSGGTGRDVGDNGTIVGSSTYDDGNFEFGPITAIRSQLGQPLEDLGRPDGFVNSEAYGINGSGAITGVAEDADFSNSRAFVYTDTDGFQVLNTLGGTFSAGRDINDDGLLVGFSETTGGKVQGFVVAPGEDGSYPELDPTLHAIPTLGGDFGNASRVNRSGQILGASRGEDGRIRGYLYRRDTGIRDLGNLPGGERAFANGLNNKGDAVGFDSIYDASDEYVETLGWLWTKTNGIRSLNTILLEDARDEWSIEYADGINDSGWIAGSGYNLATGRQHALLLKPVEVSL